jgi:ABC-type multidrug transport system permease subunit
MSTPTNDAPPSDDLAALRRTVARRHHLVGWTALLLFLSLGTFLEFLLGFKIGFYMDPGDSHLRRELWRLAHAHGALIGLIHVGFAAGVTQFGTWTAGRLKLASFFLIDAAILIPLGFFLGGVAPSEVDPWIGIVLVPLGALLLFIAVALVIASAWNKEG